MNWPINKARDRIQKANPIASSKSSSNRIPKANNTSDIASFMCFGFLNSLKFD